MQLAHLGGLCKEVLGQLVRQAALEVTDVDHHAFHCTHTPRCQRLALQRLYVAEHAMAQEELQIASSCADMQFHN